MAQNVIDHLIDEHNEIKSLFGTYDDVGPDGREELFRQIVERLARHETAEEEVVYPILRKEVENGDQLADDRISEEQEAEEVLAELEKMGFGDPGFDSMFRSLRDDVLEHAEKEEIEVFPPFRAALSEERLEELGKWLERAEATAPTHPHPNAPDTPPGIMAAGGVAAVFDRARDMFSSTKS